MPDIGEDDVLKSFMPMISGFNKDQMNEWSRWSGILPERFAYVTNGHINSGRRREFWRNISYLFLILSTIIPVIVTLLIEFLKIPTIASLIDALFPALTTIVQRKTDYWVKCLQGFSEIYSSYQRLLADIIFDITNSEYVKKRDEYEKKWEDLDQQMQEYDILQISFNKWYD